MRTVAHILLCVVLAVVVSPRPATGRERDPLALYAEVYREPDFVGVMVKLTYIGPQDKPVTGLLLSTYRLPDLEAFKPHRRPDVAYGNDDHDWLEHMTLETGGLRDVVLAIARFEGIREAAERSPDAPRIHWSLMIVDTRSPHRPNSFEALLTRQEVAPLLRNAALAVEREDPAAARGIRAFADHLNE